MNRLLEIFFHGSHRKPDEDWRSLCRKASDDRLSGRDGRAARRLRRALSICAETGDAIGAAETRLQLAALRLFQRRVSEALRLAAASRAAFESFGMAPEADRAARLEKTLRALA